MSGYEVVIEGTQPEVVISASAGPAGIQGIDGSYWLEGAGVPAAGLGRETDMYVNVTTGDYYQKQVGVWVLVGTFPGAGSAAAAAASAAAALVSENNAAASEIATGADLVLTNADVVSTNADVVLTGLDVAATNADVLLTNADVVSTAADVVLTGLDVAATNADVVSTNADVVLTGLDVTYAEEWAIEVEDTPVSVAAGGDGATTFSALHWAAKASAWVKDFITGTDTPANYTGAAGQTVMVNSTPDGLEFIDMSATATQFTATQGFTESTITYSATPAWDLAANQAAKITLTGNPTFAAPTNHATGHYYSLRMIQDATGSRIPIWNAAFHMLDGVAPVLSTAAAAEDLIIFYSDGTVLHQVSLALNNG